MDLRETEALLVEAVLPFLVAGVLAVAAAFASGWWAGSRRATVNFPAPVWADIYAAARSAGVGVDEMLRRLTWTGLYLRKRMRQDHVHVVLAHPDGDREPLFLDWL